MNAPTIIDPAVQTVFENYPPPVRERLLTLRQLILDVAARTPGVGTIEETLKWGQISYLTTRPKTGTTIRIDEYDRDQGQIAIFVHCQTTLIDTYRQLYPDGFGYEGTRAVVWHELNDEQHHMLARFIEMALMYHRQRQK